MEPLFDAYQVLQPSLAKMLTARPEGCKIFWPMPAVNLLIAMIAWSFMVTIHHLPPVMEFGFTLIIDLWTSLS